MTGARLSLPEDCFMTVPGLLKGALDARGDTVALRAKVRGIYRDMTWRALYAQTARIALGLHDLGVKRGDRVAILGDAVPEWLLADFAAQCIGAVSYGLYPTSSPEEAEFVLRHGGASILVAEDQEHVDKILPRIERLPGLRRIVVIDDSNLFNYSHPALLSLSDLLKQTPGDCEAIFQSLCDEVRPDDPATLVYTSGTSANPKGALYTHRGLVAQGHQFFAFPELENATGIRSVVHLPLNHLYERMNTPLGMLAKGIVPHFGDEVERFLETLAEVAPQHHASVPRYWSKLASRIIVGIENSSALKRRSYAVAMRIGRAYRRSRWDSRTPLALAALYWLARVLIFNRMLKKIGLNRVRIALSAGAPLPPEVQALWQVWGVNLKNLYGQTEAGVVTAQFESFPAPGSVGAPYPGVEVRLGDDQEIISQSEGCFAGYWADDKATADVLRPDGILTGDVGRIDEKSQLWIIDRKKDIVITAGGKNVSPSRIETELKASLYISEASVIGEGRKYLTALVELDVGTVAEWARANSVLYTSYRSLATNRDVYALIARDVEKANRRLGRVEQIKAFRILDRELDPEVEGEAVTATRKIKRSQLQKHFGHLIREMYVDDEEKRIESQIENVQ